MGLNGWVSYGDIMQYVQLTFYVHSWMKEEDLQIKGQNIETLRTNDQAIDRYFLTGFIKISLTRFVFAVSLFTRFFFSNTLIVHNTYIILYNIITCKIAPTIIEANCLDRSRPCTGVHHPFTYTSIANGPKIPDRIVVVHLRNGHAAYHKNDRKSRIVVVVECPCHFGAGNDGAWTPRVRFRKKASLSEREREREF